MAMNLLIATSNPGKFKEISKFLQMPGLKLFSLKDFEQVKSPLEDGKTFKENALIKAKFFAEKFKITTIADDGGLEIEILNGEPGVKTRRWIDGAHESTDEELINYCLVKLKGKTNRKAKLTACLCLCIPNNISVGVCHGKPKGTPWRAPTNNIIFSQESIAGVITEKPSSGRFAGFPFRSLLYIPQIKKFYNEDELTEEETKKYNHRYKAIAKLKKQLEICL